jgi:CDP-diacylglycerol--glycerol-3-phosphate 3-phosphatidyltransferase
MKLTVPNQLTILRIILTPVFLYFFIQNSQVDKLIGTITFFFAAGTDWYDGYIARKHNIVSRWGQFMDPLADKILISSALIAFAYLGYVYLWMVTIIICRDFLITYLRMYALQRGKSIVTSYLAKWKTFIQMVAVFVILIYLNFPDADIYHLENYPPGYLHWVSILYLLVTALTAISGIQYLIENRAHVVEIVKRTGKLFYR